MDNNLPLLMLVLACSLLILLIVYVIHYKKQQRRRRPFHSRHLQEPQIGAENVTSPDLDPDLHQLAEEMDLLGDGEIMGEVKVHTVEETLPRPAPVLKNKQQTAKRNGSSLIILHVLAEQGKTFIGYELLQSLLSAGLRFGERNIFHRHEQLSGKGEILFSVASATEPGTFNLDEVGALSCVGLSLFMDAAKVPDPRKVLNLLLDTVRLLAEDLGGRVCDERYQELTPEKISEYQAMMTVEEA